MRDDSPIAGEEAAEVAALLRLDQQQRWQTGERIPAEAYLQRHSLLRGDPDAAVDLIYGEFLLRERLGERPDAVEYLRRFPEYAEVLTAQIDLHRAVAGPQSGSTPADAETLTPAAPPPAEAARPNIPGYEILEELGRGGMGVVYKARQISLNRLVALKMILAGLYASPEELTRFRREAEAVARLQHPNVVQIFEVGEHHGILFYSFEYVEGGTLADRLERGPLSARPAAELIATLARATQHVHERGIIHRDLKPSNVLMTDGGVPKITDFGLARCLDGGSLTQSGAVVGTPNYMAPEQARGRAEAVSPATDVYGLGAILYEATTGHPPFRAETPLDTVLQVLSEEPSPPRRWQRDVPPALEAICLRCLRKTPAERYATAGELADDLDRFLLGQAVKAQIAELPVWTWTLLRMLYLTLAVGAILPLLWWANSFFQVYQLVGRAPWPVPDLYLPLHFLVALLVALVGLRLLTPGLQTLRELLLWLASVLNPSGTLGRYLLMVWFLFALIFVPLLFIYITYFISRP